MRSIIPIVAAVHVPGIHQVSIDVKATVAARVIVSEQPQNKPSHSRKNVDLTDRLKARARQHKDTHDVGDHFRTFGHAALHSGLSSKAK